MAAIRPVRAVPFGRRSAIQAFRIVRGPRSIVLSGILPLLLAMVFLFGCSPSEEETDFLAQKALLMRQNRGLREMIAEAERGSMVPKDRFLIGIDQSIVASLLKTELPIERPLGKHFVVRIEQATVLLRDKFGTIVLDGEVHRPQTPDRKTAVRVHGGLGAVAIDTTTDMLSIQIAIDHIDLVRAGLLEGVLGRDGKKFLAVKGRDLLQEALPSLRVPVVLGRSIRVPSVSEGAVQLDSLVVPLNLSVERVLAARNKLWVTLNAQVGAVKGAEGGLGVVIKKKRKSPAPNSGPQNQPASQDTGSASNSGERRS